jgi:hypothetical protein
VQRIAISQTSIAQNRMLPLQKLGVTTSVALIEYAVQHHMLDKDRDESICAE